MYEPTTFYVAGKLAERGRVRAMILALKLRGHGVTYDWTATSPHAPIILPYRSHRDINRRHAQAMLRGIAAADAFVLLGHPDLHGANIELGAALARRDTPLIALVGQERQSIFDTLPGVYCYDSDETFLDAIPLVTG